MSPDENVGVNPTGTARETVVGDRKGEPFPAQPGWRVVVVDRENGGSIALPIVAWQRHVVTFARGGRGEVHRRHEDSLLAWHLVNEEGVAPAPVKDDDVLGYLAPGDDHDGSWDEAAERLVEAETMAEEIRMRREQERVAEAPAGQAAVEKKTDDRTVDFGALLAKSRAVGGNWLTEDDITTLVALALSAQQARRTGWRADALADLARSLSLIDFGEER